MQFPCKVQLKANFNSHLPLIEYVAVGMVGNMVILEYANGWKYTVNCPPFCNPEGRYASVHKQCVGAPGTVKNNGHKMNRKVK